MKKFKYRLDRNEKELICTLLVYTTVFGITSISSYRLGCQTGVNCVRDFLQKHSPELFAQVNALFANMGPKK